MNDENSHDGSAEAEPGHNAEAASVIEQVRELLFGDHRRSTETSLKTLEDKLAALTATLEARCSDLERRIHESRADVDQTRDQNIEAIGAALKEVGERIQSLVAKSPR